MFKDFTNEQKNSYFNEGFCPFCSSELLSNEIPEFDGGNLWLGVSCDNCKANWTEEYRLRDTYLNGGPNSPIEILAKETEDCSK